MALKLSTVYQSSYLVCVCWHRLAFPLYICMFFFLFWRSLCCLLFHSLVGQTQEMTYIEVNTKCLPLVCHFMSMSNKEIKWLTSLRLSKYKKLGTNIDSLSVTVLTVFVKMLCDASYALYDSPFLLKQVILIQMCVKKMASDFL